MTLIQSVKAMSEGRNGLLTIKEYISAKQKMRAESWHQTILDIIENALKKMNEALEKEDV